MINRLRQTKELLQQAMDTGREEQVAPAYHMRDALESIVYND